MAEIQVGKVTHYFDHIGVAVVEVLGDLKEGDGIKISGRGNEFTQTVSSMQVKHEKLAEAHKDQEIGMKVDQPVKEGDTIYKIT